VVPGSSFTQITDGVVANDPCSYWGSAWVDYDNDGYIDLFVTAGGNTYPSVVNRLYRNNRNGTFTRMTASEAGALVGESGQHWGCTWGDYDNDGWPDVYVVSDTNRFYRNVGGVFQRIRDAGLGVAPDWGGTVWVDYDRDGWLDLFEASGDGSLG
jgi:enediyne biosynthesis protein E4